MPTVGFCRCVQIAGRFRLNAHYVFGVDDVEGISASVMQFPVIFYVFVGMVRFFCCAILMKDFIIVISVLH